MHLFLQWLTGETGEEWDPDRLLVARLEQLRSDDKKERRWMERTLQKYYKGALAERLVTQGPRKGEPISAAMKAAAINSVASFFANNYARLEKIKVPRRIKRATRDYWFTAEDLREMVAVAQPWARAYITLHVSLGFRIADVLALKWDDIWPYIADIPEDEVVGPIPFDTEKAGIESCSFITQDAVKALKRLRTYREEFGNVGQYIFQNSNDGAIKSDYVNRRLKTLFKRAGRDNRGLVVKSHGLRKMLYNTLKNVGTPVDVRNIIVGKAVSEDIRTYIRDDDLKKWFMKAVPIISIEEPRPQMANELKKEIEELRDRFGTTIEELQKTVKNLTRRIKTMEESTKR